MDIKNGKHWANADHGRDLTDNRQIYEISLRKKIVIFQHFIFHMLMLEQALTNLIVCLMIAQKLHTKVAEMS